MIDDISLRADMLSAYVQVWLGANVCYDIGLGSKSSEEKVRGYDAGGEEGFRAAA